jgi:hypothetical protein
MTFRHKSGKPLDFGRKFDGLIAEFRSISANFSASQYQYTQNTKWVGSRLGEWI